jgi:RimJ/RimL family protein N-acetyltransferase
MAAASPTENIPAFDRERRKATMAKPPEGAVRVHIYGGKHFRPKSAQCKVSDRILFGAFTRPGELNAAYSRPVNRVALPDCIATKRLLLRPYLLEDLSQILAYSTDEKWGEYLPSVPAPYSTSDGQKFLSTQVLLDRVEDVSWAVIKDDTVIGGVSLGFDFDRRLGTLGYAIARRLWRQGLATEAAQSVIDAAFETHPELNRIRASADGRNVASQRVMEKLGMTREALFRQDRLHRGTLVDEAWYGLLRSEWKR